MQSRVTYLAAEGFVALAEGDTRRALEATNRAIDENLAGGQEFADEAVRIAYPDVARGRNDACATSQPSRS